MEEMTRTFYCEVVGEIPLEFREAASEGELQVSTSIGWITLDGDEAFCVRNGCEYRIKEEESI